MAARRQRMTNIERVTYNELNSINQRNYRHNQGPNEATNLDNNFRAYVEDFTTHQKAGLESHPFVKNQQQQFHSAVSKYEMRYCYICQEQWPTNINLNLEEKYPPDQVGGIGIKYYTCNTCNRDRGNLKRFSSGNDMIPKTLVSGSVPELSQCLDATLLERMLCARACTVMRVV